jgi:hypothetical protein
VRELYDAPIPDLVTRISVQNLMGEMAIELVADTMQIGLDIIKAGLYTLAFSILFRATLGSLRTVKGAREAADLTRQSKDVTGERGMLPVPAYHNHHIFPEQFRKFFEKKQVKINDFTMKIERTTHLRGVHGQGMGHMPGRWNKVWEQFVKTHPDATAKDIFQQAGKMLDDYGLSDMYAAQNPSF